MKTSKSERVFNVFNIVFMLFLCIIMVYPYINQLAIAFNEGNDTMFGGITIYPRKPTFANFLVVFKNSKITGAFVLSVFRVAIGMLWSLCVTIGAAFAVTRKGMPGRKFLSWFLLIPSYINAGLIPEYFIFRYTGMMNNFLIYIIPGAFTFYNMVVLRSFLQELPPALEESAFLDGANEIQVLMKIIIPLSKPALATISLWILVSHWNDWVTTLYYITDKKLYTLQYFMMQLIKENEVIQKLAQEARMSGMQVDVRPTTESIKAATLIVSTMPIIMMYPFFQKYFIKGVTLGAVKG